MSTRSTIFGAAMLVVLLSAGAAQSLDGTNTVDSGDIIDRTIGTPDLKVGAFAGQSILDNSMTTLDINEATLKLTCAPGTTQAGDICFGPEKAASGVQPAMDLCRSKGMHLPSLSQATAVIAVAGGTDQIWTDTAFNNDGGTPTDGVVITSLSGGSFYTYDAFNSNHAFRCVIGLGARLAGGQSASADDVDDDAEYGDTPNGD